MRSLSTVVLIVGAACGRIDFDGTGNRTEGATDGPTAGLFAYSLAETGNQIKVFSVDPGSGALTERGLLPTAVEPREAVGHPSGRWLFVLSYDSSSGHAVVEKLGVDPATGDLSSQGVEVDDYGLVWGHEATFDPSGTYLYVNRYAGAGALYVYRVDPSTGVVAGQVAGSPFVAGSYSLGLALHPSGKWIYQGGLDAPSKIQIYDVNPSTGALTSNASSPVNPASLAYCTKLVMHPSGRWLFAVDDWSGGNMSTFSVDQQTGALTWVEDEPDPTCTRLDMVAQPSGALLYATCNPGDRVERLSVDPSTGHLTSTRFAVGTPGSHLQFTLSPTGKHLQKAFNEPDGSVDIYTIAPDGSVSLASSMSLGAGFTKVYSLGAE